MKTIIDFDGNPVDAYSKDEVIAIFTELKTEIEKCIEDTENYSDYNAGLRQGIYAIQQKISLLKEKNDNNNA